MDIKTLIDDAKARFNHNSGKIYLKEKYSAKLIVADQGGLWIAEPNLISFLKNIPGEVVVIDSFNNPVKVSAFHLHKKLYDLYNSVMNDWYNEWIELENKR
jgi:hypothetical protein